MRNILWILILVNFLSLSAGDCTWAQEQLLPFSKITVVSDDNYPPYIFRDSGGNIQGILVDQWRLWEKKTGIKVNLVGMDWAKAQETIQQGKADVIDTIFFTEQRAKIYDFSKPYVKIEVPIFFHKNISGITNIKSVQGFSVGVKKGDACIDMFRKNGIIKELVEYDSYEDIIKDAAKEKIRVFCIDKPPALYYLNKYNLIENYHYSPSLSSGEFHRAVKKGRNDLLAVVERGFSSISQKEYEAIDKKWFGTALLTIPGYVRYIGVVLIVIGVAFIVLFSFNVILRKQVQTKTSDLLKTNLLLQESERRFRALAENSVDMIMRFDGNLRHLYVNPRVESDTGIMPDIFIGKTHRELGFPEDLCALWEDVLNEVFETGEVKRIEFQLPTNIWIDWLVMPENDAHGNVAAVITSARDITERKLREEELKIFKESLENSMDAIGMSTPQGRHYYQNKAFSKLFGDIGESPPETLYVDKKIGDEVFLTIMSGRQWTGEVKMYSKNKDVLDIYLRAYANKDSNGNITALVGIHTDITERKRSEAALRQSEKKFAASFTASPDSLILARVSDGRIIEANDTFLNTMDYSRDEVIGKTARELEIWSNPEHMRNYVAALQGTGAVNGMETAFRSKDGRIIPALISGRLLEIHGDMCSISIAHDISELKRAEVLIRESEEKYRTLVNNLNVGIYRNTGGPHGRFIQANPTMITMFGYDSLEEFLEISVSDLYQHPDDRKLYIEEIQSTGSVKDKELAMKKKDGSPLWASITANAQYDENGEIKWMDGVVEDITERKKVAAALQESEERLRIILHGSPIPAFVIGKDHRVIHWNDALEQLSGISADSITGTREQWRAFYDHERPCMADLIVDGSFKTIPEWYPGKHSKSKLIDDAYEATDFFPSLGDKGKWLRFTAAPLRNAEGDLIGAIETLEDITDRILAEKERKRLEAQLVQAQKMESIGTLAGGIAHDFNNILAAIIGYSEIALEDVSDPEKTTDEIREVIKAGERAKNLVSQILTFSRKTESKYSTLELPTLVKETLKMLRSVIPTTIDIRQDLINSGLVMSDPTQIHQMMMNLCTNAAHAMDETGGVLSISLRKVNIEQVMARNLDVSPGPFLRLCVSDTGHGMPPDVMERIFEPYYTTKELGRGTGLGLSVVHGIVKSQGGAITCKSEPGKGTTFDIYLPELELETQAHKPTREEPIPTGTERILYVDDEQAITSMAEKMLGLLGYNVTVMTSSLKALEVFKAKPDTFDLVITDMTMPGMTGDKLALKLMEIRPDIPVILCTGYSEHISAEKAASIGIREYVMKPLQQKVLAETIRNVLDTV